MGQTLYELLLRVYNNNWGKTKNLSAEFAPKIDLRDDEIKIFLKINGNIFTQKVQKNYRKYIINAVNLKTR